MIFDYTAMNAEGKACKGRLEAENPMLAALHIKEMELFPTSVRCVDEDEDNGDEPFDESTLEVVFAGFKFEQSYGWGEMIGLCVAVLRKILVDKGVCTKEEVQEYLLKAIKKRMQKAEEYKRAREQESRKGTG